MPPGYEDSLETNNNKAPQSVTCRLGPPSGALGIANLTRTVPNSPQRKPVTTPALSYHPPPVNQYAPPPTQANPEFNKQTYAPHADIGQAYAQPVPQNVPPQSAQYPGQAVQYPQSSQTHPQSYPQPSRSQGVAYPPPLQHVMHPGQTVNTPPYPTTDLHPVAQQQVIYLFCEFNSFHVHYFK